MKPEYTIILGFGGALFCLAVLGFFLNPIYDKGVWFIISAFSTALGTVMGFLFGKSQPDQKKTERAEGAEGIGESGKPPEAA